jgi:hypothetical protein
LPSGSSEIVREKQVQIFEGALGESCIRAHRVNEVDGDVCTLECRFGFLNRKEVTAPPLDASFAVFA